MFVCKKIFSVKFNMFKFYIIIWEYWGLVYIMEGIGMVKVNLRCLENIWYVFMLRCSLFNVLEILNKFIKVMMVVFKFLRGLVIEFFFIIIRNFVIYVFNRYNLKLLCDVRV